MCIHRLLWNFGSLPSMEINRWELASRPNLQRDEGPALRIQLSVACVVACVAVACARASPLPETSGPIFLGDRAALHSPSDDKVLPAAPQGTLILSPPFDSADFAFGTLRADGSDVPMPDVHKP